MREPFMGLVSARMETCFCNNGGGIFGPSFAVLEVEVSQLQTVLAMRQAVVSGTWRVRLG